MSKPPNQLKSGLDLPNSGLNAIEAQLETLFTQQLALGNAILEFTAKVYKTFLSHLDCSLDTLMPNENERVHWLNQIWLSSLKVALLHPTHWNNDEITQHIETTTTQYLQEGVFEKFAQAFIEKFTECKVNQLMNLMEGSSELCPPMYDDDSQYSQASEAEAVDGQNNALDNTDHVTEVDMSISKKVDEITEPMDHDNEFNDTDLKTVEVSNRSHASGELDETQEDELATNLESNSKFCYCDFCAAFNSLDDNWKQYQPSGWMCSLLYALIHRYNTSEPADASHASRTSNSSSLHDIDFSEAE